jgi:hypothetical protein
MHSLTRFYMLGFLTAIGSLNHRGNPLPPRRGATTPGHAAIVSIYLNLISGVLGS